ncbi:MAG TPA: PAS domain S-box protein, partial [Anaerolineales bacterium]|nr:PAS domain S-box protein [Anaerolineales bacterium]
MKTPTRILIVEDVAADVDLAKHAIGKVLETCEFEVVETRGDFLKSLETFQPDLILSDYSLPHFDGMKALKLALKQAPFTPLIIWTGSISEDVAVDCMKAGANNYVLKENLKRLGPAVVHALEERELLVERQQAQEKLKERERQLTILFGNLPGPVYRCRNDANYTVEFISDGIMELSGYPAADFHQDRRHFGRMIHPADQERVWAEIQTAVAESQPFELTYRILTATGEEKWVWEKGLGVRDTEGHLQGLEGFITDVTRRKQAEKIVAESEQRYRAVTELVSDYAYSYRVAPEGTLQQEWVTDAYHRITGYDPTELRGEGAWRKLIHPDDLALASEHVKKIFAGRQNVAEYRIVTKSGQVRYLRDFARPLWDEKENRIVRMIGAAQDITERKQAEEALQNSEKRFRALIEHGLDSISLLAPDGTLIWESPATFRTLDYSQNEYVGHNIFELMHPDDLEWTRDLFIKLVQEPGNSQRAIFRLRHSNGTWRWVEAVGTNMLNEPSVQAIVINYRDITERKQAGETLQYALEETKRSELLLFKLSEVSQVIQRAHSAEEVYHAIGEGLSSLGYRVTILSPTEGRQHFTVAHTTVSSKILNALEKITGFSFLTYRFPLVEGGFLKEVIDKGEATLSVLNEEEVAKILPGPLRLLAPTVLQLVDTHDVISVPIAARDESYSLFLVDAHQLTEADVPPITAFAAQASIALENAQLYESIRQELYERKRAEEKLSLSDQILQRVNALVLVSDSQGSIVYVSPAARLILGYEPDELLGDNWWRLSRVEPGEAQNEREYVEGAARGETPMVSEAYERPIRDRWGNIRWISWVDAAGPGDLLIGVGHDVTERKQAESRINDLLAFNEKILNHSSIGILTYKLTGECVFANGNAASMIGSQVEQLRTQNFRTIAAWKKSGLYDLAEKAITTQAAVTADLHHISTFGKDLWITAHCVTFKWKEEDHLLLSISDISERKRAEEALRESENRLILALSGAQMSVWEWNLQTNRILWSPEFFEITGVTEDDFGGTFESFTNLIHPQDVARVRASAEKALADKALFAEEFRIIRPDGEIRWLSNLGHAEYDPIGSYLRLIGTVQDVTQRKRAEEALRQSENRYRTLVETQTEFIVRWKSDGIRTFANEAYCRYFGLTPEQAISGKFMPLVYEQDRQGVEEKLQRLLAGVTNVETETHRVIKPDGSIGWQEWTDQAIYDNDG